MYQEADKTAEQDGTNGKGGQAPINRAKQNVDYNQFADKHNSAMDSVTQIAKKENEGGLLKMITPFLRMRSRHMGRIKNYRQTMNRKLVWKQDNIYHTHTRSVKAEDTQPLCLIVDDSTSVNGEHVRMILLTLIPMVKTFEYTGIRLASFGACGQGGTKYFGGAWMSEEITDMDELLSLIPKSAVQGIGWFTKICDYYSKKMGGSDKFASFVFDEDCTSSSWSVSEIIKRGLKECSPFSLFILNSDYLLTSGRVNNTLKEELRKKTDSYKQVFCINDRPNIDAILGVDLFSNMNFPKNQTYGFKF